MPTIDIYIETLPPYAQTLMSLLAVGLKMAVPFSNNYFVFRLCLQGALLAAIIKRSVLLAAIRPN